MYRIQTGYSRWKISSTSTRRWFDKTLRVTLKPERMQTSCLTATGDTCRITEPPSSSERGGFPFLSCKDASEQNKNRGENLLGSW